MNWANAAIFFAIIAGHCQLQVMLVNRMHAVRLRCSTLRTWGRLHDVAMPLFPVLLVWLAGLGGPRLLLDGEWGDAAWGWWAVFAACGFGTVILARSTLRWSAARAPAALVSNHSTVVDVAERLGTAPIGGGRTSFLARWPGNQVFQLEVNEKRVRHPRWPAAWNGLSILHVSDTHFCGPVDLPFFREVAEIASAERPDLVAFTGDLLDRRSLTSWLPETLGKILAPLGCYFVLGNHDWYLQPDEIRCALAELGWVDVARRCASVPQEKLPDAPLRLTLAGDERPWMGGEAEFDGDRQQSFRLLLSHTPDNLPWARRNGVDLMLAGHIHGGQIVLPILGPIYAPSRYGTKYVSGLYWEHPTLLHVSRGVSGRLPLRWNCRPELTKLVLESGGATGT
ncbi:MAG: metallophosphoesterase [Planctomycetaceae bacterium]